jgi:hypothetical protein
MTEIGEIPCSASARPFARSKRSVYRTQREELEKTLISYHIHSEGTIPIVCASIIISSEKKTHYIYKHDRKREPFPNFCQQASNAIHWRSDSDTSMCFARTL